MIQKVQFKFTFLVLLLVFAFSPFIVGAPEPQTSVVPIGNSNNTNTNTTTTNPDDIKNTTKAVDCSTWTNCEDCTSKSSSACGWCDRANQTRGACIPNFNILYPNGDSVDQCFGDLESYKWMQCKFSARTTILIGIIALIVFGLAFVCCCSYMIRRRLRIERGMSGDGQFKRMVDTFEMRYSKR